MTDKVSKANWDFFQLPRPEYPPHPQLLMSELLWQLTESRRPPKSIDGKDTSSGITYKRIEHPKNPNNKIGVMIPEMHSPKKELVEILRDQFDTSLSQNDEKLEASVNVLFKNLQGVAPPKAQSYAVLPLNAATALMQDRFGVTGKSGPVDFAKIIETINLIGGGEVSAGKLLLDSYLNLTDQEGLQWFEEMTEAMLAEELQKCLNQLKSSPIVPVLQHSMPEWLRGKSTPFSWFAKVWPLLMNQRWKSRMPRRRWTDWCTCVLRTAIGMGYLYEMNFYFRVTEALLDIEQPPEDEAKRILASAGSLLKWNSDLSISSRDLNQQLKICCARGRACREMLQTFCLQEEPCPIPRDYCDSEQGLINWIREMRAWVDKNSERDSLSACMSGVENRKNNMHETIKYSLLGREQSSEEPDFYSLLKKPGKRYTIVEPGPEWFVVISSLEVTDEAESCRIDDIVGALDALGIEAGNKTLINELERVGLARSSHDADGAIEVAAAF